METNKINVLTVVFDSETGLYNVSIPQGSNIAETAFAISVVIRCLLRDGLITNIPEFMAQIVKYTSDPQWSEKDEAHTN